MLRRYFISDDLDDLAKIEQELEQQGIETPQIHVLSENDAEVELRHLHEVAPVLKSDVVHATEIGAIVGVIGALVVLALAYIMGWTDTAAGWVPFIFLAVVVLGFCTWEGGFIGIQQPNVNFKRFQDLLHQGKHVLFIDIAPEQEAVLSKVIRKHPGLQSSGEGEATPGWVVRSQQLFRRFVKTMP